MSAQLLETDAFDISSAKSYPIRNAELIPVLFRLSPALRPEYRHLLLDCFIPLVEKTSHNQSLCSCTHVSCIHVS
jgi:hypothetical protein